MTSTPRIQQVKAQLYLIALPVPIPGFEEFIGAWVYTAGPVVIVDVGPAKSAPHLLAALAELDVHRPDVILLTHIHIDHAGGIGQIAAAFADTPVICHPKARSHLVEPDRLWQGSVKTLREIALAYGPIQSVAVDQILTMDQLAIPDITAIETLGHSPHHCSYMIGNLLFAGEAGGVCLSLPDGSFYLRPATPPRFFLETSLASIDRLMAAQPHDICYGHVGLREEAVAMLQAHRDQLLRWKALIQPWVSSIKTDPEVALQACGEHLLAHDPLLAAFPRLSVDVRQREHTFLHNSIKGYWDYLAAC